MKTAHECFLFLQQHHSKTNRSLDQKRGRGIHTRVLHYTNSKEIRALASFAEVKTLEGSCTHEGHFFCDTRQPGEVLVRPIACLNCSSCSKLDWGHCVNTETCGLPKTRTIKLKSNVRSEAPALRSAIHLSGLQRASTVRPGMYVGSENVEEHEPYIISVALDPERIWTGPDGKSWNGVIKAGDRFIRAQKLHRKSALVYVETDSEFIFFLNSEDVRVPDLKCTVIEERRRRSTRNSSTDSASKSYKFRETEVELLKCHVHMPAIYDILNPA